MKKKFIFFTLLLLTLIGGVKFNVLNAQEDVATINGDATSYVTYYPICFNYNYGLSQHIYTSSDIGHAAGVIDKIAFKVNYTSTRDITLYMQNTDITSFGSDYTTYISYDNMVYSNNSLNTASVDGWLIIDIEDFEYDGTGLLITSVGNTGSSVYPPSGQGVAYAVVSEYLTLYKTSSTTFTPGSLYGSKRQPAIKLFFAASEPSVKITPESIDLGTVRTDANFFTEKPFDYSNYAVTVKAQGGAVIETNTIQQEGDFFKIVEVYNIDGGYQYHISYNQNGTTGDKEGTLVVTYKDSESETETKTATIPLRANAYAATEGEAIENPIEVAFTNNAFTHAATGMHDDYILPGEENDGNLNDAVYKFTLENDAVLTANVTGTNPIVAIYNEDFGEKEGPSSDNNYEGVSNEPEAPSAPTTFGPYTFDDGSLEDFTLIDADGDGYNWISSENTVKGYDGSKGIQSDSYRIGIGKLHPDNYIITQDAYLITSSSQLSYYVNAHASWPSEQYSVLLIEDIEKLSSAEVIYNHTLTKTDINKTVTHDLSAYVGKIMHIAIRHHDCSDIYSLVIDNLQLTDGSAKSRSVAQTRSTNQIDRVLYPAGTYYLVAAAEGNFTLNLSTEALSAPAAATLTAPANEATEQNNPLLTWTLDKFAEKYQLLLGTTNPPTDIVVDWSAPATSYQTKDLANNTVYYWQVKSKNSVGESLSEVFSFVTPLNKPTNVTASKTNLYPGDETTISWTEAAGATSYNVYVGENKVASEVTSPYTLSSLEYNVNPGHNVTVTANHTLGESAKSDAVVVKVAGTFPLTVNVKDSKGNPIEGATVTFNTSSALDEFQNTITAPEALTTNAEGVAEIILPLIYNDPNTFGEQIIVYANRTPFKQNFTSITPSGLSNDVLKEVNINLSLPAPSNLVPKNDEYMLLVGQDLTLNWTAVEGVTGYNVYKTSGNGVYTFVKTVTENTYTAVAEYDAYGSKYAVSAVFEGGLESDKAVTYDYIYVLGTGDVKGLVTDTEGNPVAGAALELSGKNNFGEDIHILGTTEDDGTFLVEDVIEGTYSLTVSHYNYEAATVSDISVSNIEYELEIELTPKASIENVTVTADNNGNVSWTGDYAKWNVYRRNTNAPQELTSVATKLEATSTTDAEWETLKPGRYQYGVAALVEPQAQTRGTEVIFEERFENNGTNIPTGWSSWNSSGSSSPIDWTPATRLNYGSYNSYEGTYSAFSNGTSGGGYAYIQTIDIELSGEAYMNFYYIAPSWGGDINSLIIKVIPQDTYEEYEVFNTNKTNCFAWTSGYVDLSGYQGKTIKIQFICENGYGYGVGIDDIVITGEVTSEVETQIVWSNEVVKQGPNTFEGTVSTDWNVAENWSHGNAPEAGDEVIVNAEAVISGNVELSTLDIVGNGSVTVDANASLTVTGAITQEQDYSLIMNDGAQVFQNNANVTAQFNMNLVNPSDWSTSNKDGWQFISSPLSNVSVTNIAEGNYDLYKYDGDAESELEWLNHKDANFADATYQHHIGYLASHETMSTLEFKGTLNYNDYYGSYAFFDYVEYYENEPLKNFYLIGNPYPFNISWADFKNNKGMVNGYAYVKEDGNYGYATSGTINVGDGFFVQAISGTPDDQYSTYYYYVKDSGNTRSTKASNNSLNITATGNAGKDNVVINFAGKSEGFDKLQNFNDAIATVYVAEGGKNYGIYNCESDVQEIQLNFNANKMGNYTISIEPNGKFQTVTLVDRFTGIETNMLVEDYHFTAMSGVNNNRFIVKLAVSDQQSAVSDNFVYQSGEDLIIDAEGTVQIIDVMGRVLVSDEVESTNNRINVSGFQNGTYMVRVINGSEVKVEKVVIY